MLEAAGGGEDRADADPRIENRTRCDRQNWRSRKPTVLSHGVEIVLVSAAIHEPMRLTWAKARDIRETSGLAIGCQQLWLVTTITT